MLTSTQVGHLAGCSRHTVERACHNEELAARKLGRNWMIEDEDGERWAQNYKPHARTGRTLAGRPGAKGELPEAGKDESAGEP